MFNYMVEGMKVVESVVVINKYFNAFNVVHGGSYQVKEIPYNNLVFHSGFLVENYDKFTATMYMGNERVKELGLLVQKILRKLPLERKFLSKYYRYDKRMFKDEILEMAELFKLIEDVIVNNKHMQIKLLKV